VHTPWFEVKLLADRPQETYPARFTNSAPN
jgi:hypothetical protein